MDRLERENNQQPQKTNNPLNSFTTIAQSFNNSLAHGNNSAGGCPLSTISPHSNNSSANANSINSGQQIQLNPLSLNSDNLNYEQNLSNTGNNTNLFGMGLQPSTSKLNTTDATGLHNNIVHKYGLQPIMLQNSLNSLNSLNDEQNELMEFKKKGVLFLTLFYCLYF